MLSVGVGGQISWQIQTGGGGGGEGVLGQRTEGSHGVSGDRGTQFGRWSSATTGRCLGLGWDGSDNVRGGLDSGNLSWRWLH